MDLLQGLNDRQQKAVLHTDGALLILAGAGSGKTRTIIHRIAHIIQSGKARPYEILALTFTNKAAQEMKDRIIKMNIPDANGLWMSTFHSLCARLLRVHSNLIGYERSFVIYDSSDQKSILKECFKELNIDDKSMPIASVSSAISKAKEKGHSVIKFERDNQGDYKGEKIASIYKLYQNKLISNNAMDFDDLLVNVVKLLEENEEILNHYQNKFKYIVVDEYQDTNPIQYRIVGLLANKYKNLCVCGDDDQSIYGFRGADIRNILEFEKDFNNAEIIRLEQNYRSSSVIIEAANCVIQNNPQRKSKEMWTDNSSGELIELKQLFSEREESDYIAAKIKEMVKTTDYNYGDFTILYRTNAQSRVFEESFMSRGIPYQIIGGLKFYSRMEIKDIISYLILLENAKDDVSFKRVINIPKRGIGNATIEKIQQFADFKGESLFEVVLNVEEIVGLSKSVIIKLTEFSDIMKDLMELKDSLPLSQLIDNIMIKTGYMNMLNEGKIENALNRKENLQELVSSAVEFETNSDDISLTAFLESVSLVADIDDFSQEQGQVKLMTLHNAKGLEFPIVFLPGLEENIFPHARSLYNDTELHEERRLCYVGITRAMEKLFITFTNYRKLYGKTSYNSKSRFIDEIPKELFVEDLDKKAAAEKDRANKNNLSRKNGMLQQVSRMNTTYAQEKKSSNTDITEGTKVNHAKWGIGTVINISGTGDDAIASIAFPGMGIKKLALSMAPITKV
ncbi:DNA helicase PcrA [Alkalibaculum sp. M08DMB]|uniref:ATP-dependent DNA helicase n=1 Tax=Alkalibaculum sporogenes TaxID=2655001 RepID=A0A6A7K720_9FIRM|nr:DNA helicase PcrA [Alkalibaculum sporogenes]MPW24913.1 DNA helicase PcrA [Alkalibaculum sporogenes]